jgi:hypothetical protein
MKRKRTNKDREPRRREEKIPESARRLRELYERGMAELEERRKIDPNYR